MEKTKQIISDDREKDNKPRFLWYMKKFGINTGDTYDNVDLVADNEFDQPRLSLDGMPLTMSIKSLSNGEGILFAKTDAVNCFKGDGVEITNDRIKFCRSNPNVEYSTWSWEICEEKLTNGISLKFSSLSSGLTSLISICYDDYGNITIKFICKDYVINKSIPFGEPHPTTEEASSYLADTFSDEEYLKRSIREIPESDKLYQNIEIDLISAMLDDPIIEETLAKMFEQMPEIVFKKRKDELTKKYIGIECKNPDDKHVLELRYNADLHVLGATLKYATINYQKKPAGSKRVKSN